MKRNSIEDVRLEFKNRGLTLINEEYKNENQLLVALDSDGYKVCCRFKHFKAGHMPRRFHTSNPYTIENIHRYLKLSDRGKKVRLNSDAWVNANTKLSFTCLIDGHTWEATWGSFYSNGNGCPKCVNRCGKNNPSWKGGTTPLHKIMRKSILPWRLSSYEKYDYCCDITGSKLTDNVIHHHYNYCDILRETLEELNIDAREKINDYTEEELELMKSKCLELHYKYGLGICLTKKLHDEFHSIYGRKNNTMEQYMEFKNNKLKEISGK